MSIRRVTKARRGAAAAALAAALALAVAGCGSGDGEQSADGSSQNSAASDGDDGQKPKPQSTETIGEAKGPDGIVLAISSAVRDGGGFVTVSGTVTNKGERIFNASAWRSQETDLKSRSSISGASLVDPAGKKRYLILRDTDGECLCTTGLANIKPGESRPVFAQFPAPPAKVTDVDFQIPTMPSVSVELTG